MLMTLARARARCATLVRTVQPLVRTRPPTASCAPQAGIRRRAEPQLALSARQEKTPILGRLLVKRSRLCSPRRGPRHSRFLRRSLCQALALSQGQRDNPPPIPRPRRLRALVPRPSPCLIPRRGRPPSPRLIRRRNRQSSPCRSRLTHQRTAQQPRFGATPASTWMEKTAPRARLDSTRVQAATRGHRVPTAPPAGTLRLREPWLVPRAPQDTMQLLPALIRAPRAPLGRSRRPLPLAPTVLPESTQQPRALQRAPRVPLGSTWRPPARLRAPRAPPGRLRHLPLPAPTVTPESTRQQLPPPRATRAKLGSIRLPLPPRAVRAPRGRSRPPHHRVRAPRAQQECTSRRPARPRARPAVRGPTARPRDKPAARRAPRAPLGGTKRPRVPARASCAHRGRRQPKAHRLAQECPLPSPRRGRRRGTLATPGSTSAGGAARRAPGGRTRFVALLFLFHALPGLFSSDSHMIESQDSFPLPTLHSPIPPHD